MASCFIFKFRNTSCFRRPNPQSHLNKEDAAYFHLAVPAAVAGTVLNHQNEGINPVGDD